MKKIIFLTLLLLVSVGLALFIFRKGNQKEFEPQLKTFGRVEVTVTPKQISHSKLVVFDLSFSNHAIDLSYDFREIIKLTDNLGNSYKAVSWDGGSGGHHVNGEISFGVLKKGVKNVALKLEGVDGVTETFKFNIN